MCGDDEKTMVPSTVELAIVQVLMYTEYESRAASYLMNHLYLATIYLLTIPPSPHQSPSPHRTASFDGVKPQPILSIFGAYPIRECTTTIMILHASMWGDNNEPWMGRAGHVIG